MTTIWKHQQEAIDMAVQHPGFMIAADMGTGKTYTTIKYLERINATRTLVLAPKSVVSVWPSQLDKHVPGRFNSIALYEGSVPKKAQRLEEFCKLQQALRKRYVAILNYDSAWRSPLGPDYNEKNKQIDDGLLMKIPWDVIVCDECVPAGTMISTENGDKPIESLKIGDIILGVDHHTGNIVQTIIKDIFQNVTEANLCKINTTEMTPNHPVFTQRGYIPANSINNDDYIINLVGDKALELRMVREIINKHTSSNGKKTNRFETFLREIMFCKMENVKTRVRRNTKYSKTSRDFSSKHAKNEIRSRSTTPFIRISSFRQKPISKSRSKAKGEINITKTRVLSAYRWQRKGPNRTTRNSSGTSRGRLGARIYCKNRVQSWFPLALQNRYSQSKANDSNRNRWAIASIIKNKRKRYEKNQFFNKQRMDSLSFQERGNHERFIQCDSANQVVYNIETGTGNYFANRLLVHNCHRIKGSTSNIGKFAAKLGKKSKYRIGLTGTPFPNDFQDVFGQHRFLDESIFGNSVYAFKLRYAVMGGFEGRKVIGLRKDREQEFHRKFYSIAHKVNARDVIQLPDVMHEIRAVELSPKARKLYDTLEKEFVAQLDTGEITANNAMVKLLRLQQMAGGFVQLDDGSAEVVDKAKLDTTKDLFEDLPASEPIVVFCVFRNEIERIREIAEQSGRTSGELSGSQNDLKDWRDGKLNVLVVQIRSGGVGIDLTRARYCIYFSTGFSLGDYDQSLARQCRPGADLSQKVVYYHIIGKDTVDEKVAAALMTKRKAVDYVLEDLRMPKIKKAA